MAGSYKLRPSKIALALSFRAKSSKFGLRNSSHSVITASTSAPSSAASAEFVNSTFLLSLMTARALAMATGS